MNGITNKGVVVKLKVPGMSKPETVKSAKNFKGQTGSVSSKKTSNSAGFSISRKKGSIKGA